MSFHADFKIQIFGLLPRGGLPTLAQGLEQCNCDIGQFSSVTEMLMGNQKSFIELGHHYYEKVQRLLLKDLVELRMSFALIFQNVNDSGIITFAAETGKIALVSNRQGEIKIHQLDNYYQSKITIAA